MWVYTSWKTYSINFSSKGLVCVYFYLVFFFLGTLLNPRARETVSDSSIMTPDWLQCCHFRLDGALSYGVLLYSLFLVFLFYGLQLVSELSRGLVIRCLHFLSTPVQGHPLYLEKITLSISLLLRYRPLMLNCIPHLRFEQQAYYNRVFNKF